MSKRTDTHRPSAIQPLDYEYVAAMTRADSLDGAMILQGEREALQRHRAATGGSYSTHDHGGSCHVCGAWFIDYAIFYHAPSNAYIQTGFDCAEKLGGGDERTFRAIRNERQALEWARAGKLKATAILRERELLERVESLFASSLGDAVDIAPLKGLGLDFDLMRRGEDMVLTAADIVRKLIKYGELSDKQWTFLVSLLDKIENISKTQEERQKERAARIEAPEGRQTLVGEVVSLKSIESEWGTQHKMLVKEDRNFMVWSSVPRAISGEVERGARVEFTATLSRSKDDSSFAIAKRPSKARKL